MTNSSKKDIFSDLDWLLDGKARKISSSQDGKQMLFQLSKGEKRNIKSKAESQVESREQSVLCWHQDGAVTA